MTFGALLGRELILLDGAMGTMLQQRGLQPGQSPEALNISSPQVVAEVHRAYQDAGSRAVYTNTFGASEHKLAGAGLQVEPVIDAAVQAARQAVGAEGFVGLDIGPTGQLVEPMGSLSFEDAYEIFRRQVVQGVKSGVDFIAIESFCDLYEAKAALLAAKEHSSLPVIVTMSFEENLRSYTGCHIYCMAATLESLGADAIGINCSLGPVQILPLAKALAQRTSLPLVAKPNAGLPVYHEGVSSYDITPEQFAAALAEYLPLGFGLVGGCCGTTPAHIVQLAARLQNKPLVSRQNSNIPQVVCSASRWVELPLPGELPVLDTASHQLDELIEAGMDAMAEGAQLFCLRLAGNAPADLAVKTLQASLPLPLVLECPDPSLLEAALRCYNGRPAVIATSPEEHKLAEKYGAAVL